MNREHKHYVAVVDDDASVARAFARLLRSAGYEPITYPSAEAFLDDTRQPDFDCLVLDSQLEGISGLELARRLAAVSHPAPILLVTARDDPEERAQALAAGCAGYFLKADPGADIIERIDSAIHARMTNHPGS
ncbi:MAG TPA: response regulator [Luteolibacter sp.]|nr:response regulator [Luteolibacter sp.]